jgi:hypothetical protein
VVVNGDYWREIGRAAEEFSNLDPSTLAQMIKEEENTIAEAERAKEAHRQHGNRVIFAVGLRLYARQP